MEVKIVHRSIWWLHVMADQIIAMIDLKIRILNGKGLSDRIPGNFTGLGVCLLVEWRWWGGSGWCGWRPNLSRQPREVTRRLPERHLTWSCWFPGCTKDFIQGSYKLITSSSKRLSLDVTSEKESSSSRTQGLRICDHCQQDANIVPRQTHSCYHCITGLITYGSSAICVRSISHTVDMTYDSLVHICQSLVHLRVGIEGAKLLDREVAASLHAYQFRYKLEKRLVRKKLLIGGTKADEAKTCWITVRSSLQPSTTPTS